MRELKEKKIKLHEFNSPGIHKQNEKSTFSRRSCQLIFVESTISLFSEFLLEKMYFNRRDKWSFFRNFKKSTFPPDTPATPINTNTKTFSALNLSRERIGCVRSEKHSKATVNLLDSHSLVSRPIEWIVVIFRRLVVRASSWKWNLSTTREEKKKEAKKKKNIQSVRVRGCANFSYDRQINKAAFWLHEEFSNARERKRNIRKNSKSEWSVVSD